jgi:hypothetical protein
MAAVDVRLQIYRPTVLACGNWYHLLHCGLSSSMCDFASSVPPADVARTLRIPGKTRTLLVCRHTLASACVRASPSKVCDECFFWNYRPIFR